MTRTQQTLIYVGVGIGVYLYLSNKAEKVVKAITPTNPENVFYTGVNDVGAALTGDQSFSFGGWVYDITHSEGE